MRQIISPVAGSIAAFTTDTPSSSGYVNAVGGVVSSAIESHSRRQFESSHASLCHIRHRRPSARKAILQDDRHPAPIMEAQRGNGLFIWHVLACLAIVVGRTASGIGPFADCAEFFLQGRKFSGCIPPSEAGLRMSGCWILMPSDNAPPSRMSSQPIRMRVLFPDPRAQPIRNLYEKDDVLFLFLQDPMPWG